MRKIGERVVAKTIDDAEEFVTPDECPSQYSDDAITVAFTTKHWRDLNFVPEWGWLRWDGRRWRLEPDVAVMDLARLVCRSEAARCREDQGVPHGIRDRLTRHIASARTVVAIEKLARGDAKHLSTVADWDREPWLLNTPGGTIDLRTGIRCPHNRKDRLTKITNATPQGTPERFLKFLAQVTGGDLELQTYLQRLAGYCLVGDPKEECVDFLYGPGGNGKGTFIDALQYALGDYATTANADTFTASKVDRHPTDIAKLAGARLVVASEINEDREWDEARLKALTGRDVLTARKMRQDFFNFRAQFTLIIVGNHKPTLRTVDDAIRRRFHLVPFIVSISDEERDSDLKETLRSEADGILAWALEGCIQWQQLNGLRPPAVVLDATREYLAEEDAVGIWLEDCCERGAQYKEASRLLFESFRCWQENRGEPPLTQNSFTKRLTAKHGFRRERNANERLIAGLQLTGPERADATQSLGRRRKQSKTQWR